MKGTRLLVPSRVAAKALLGVVLVVLELEVVVSEPVVPVVVPNGLAPVPEVAPNGSAPLLVPVAVPVSTAFPTLPMGTLIDV